jgi:hypothetical protein
MILGVCVARGGASAGCFWHDQPKQATAATREPPSDLSVMVQGVFSNPFVILSAAKNPAEEAKPVRAAVVQVDSSLRCQ